MKSFFQTILIITLATGLMIVLFLFKIWGKNYLNRKKIEIRERDRRAKLLKLYQVFFHSLLQKLSKNEILWIEVSVEHHEHLRLNIQKNTAQNAFLLSFHSCQSAENMISQFDRMGIKEVTAERDGYVVKGDDQTLNFEHLISVFSSVLNMQDTLNFKFRY